MKNIIGDSHVIVDSSSLMSDSAESIFIDKFDAFFNKNIFIPASVVHEINKLSKSTIDKKRRSAKKAIKIVNDMLSKNRGIICGDVNVAFGDQDIIIAITTLYTKNNVVLLSNDSKLCIDSLKINNQQSIRTKYHVRAFFIKNNILEQFTPRKFKDYKKRNSIFNMGATLINTKTILDIPTITENDSVYDSKKNVVVIGKKIGGGGEGIVYKTNLVGLCAKVYLKGKLTKELLDKLELMVGNPLKYSGICWPESILYFNNRPIGILIPEASGEVAQISACHPAILKKNTHLNKLDIVNILLKIVQGINFLHSHNVILGDINLQNIMVDLNKNTAFLIDCDSYQINGYPCSVGTVNFTAPEIQGKNYNTFLRTKEHELFALATLIFMFLLPGKPPYSQQGGETQEKNIKNKQFPYPFEGKSLKSAPEGTWKFMWSHLPYRVKEALYECFANGKRISAEKWIEILNGYKHALEQGHVSNQLFPVALKVLKEENPHEVKCSIVNCENIFEIPKNKLDRLTNQGKKVICPVCLRRERIKKAMNDDGMYNNSNTQNTTSHNSKNNSNASNTSGYFSLFKNFFSNL